MLYVENMDSYQTTLKQNQCPVNSLEQLGKPLNIGENVLVMAKQIKKVWTGKTLQTIRSKHILFK